MPEGTFVWGAGGARKTPEEIARERAVADALINQGMDFSPVGSWTQGLARVANAAAGAFGNWQINKQEAAGRAGADKVIAALLGGGQPSAPTGPSESDYQPGAVQAPPSGDARDLMIRTIYGEAGGEPPEGQLGVASVIKNRLASGKFGGTLQDVILAPKQFSLWNKGDPAGDMARRLSPDDPHYQKIGQVVDAVLAGQAPDPTGGALNYYNPNVASPAWGPQLALANDVRIGNHRFVGNGGQSAPGMVQVAQAANTGDPTQQPATSQPQGGGSPTVQQLMEAASNPWLSDGQRMVIGALLKQQMERSDPSYQLDMDYKRAQIDALRNKPPPSQPADIQEYEYAKQQGFTGSYLDFQTALRKAGATNVDARQMGNIPPGYQIVEDPTGGTRRMEPIPGSPAEAEVRAAAEKQKAKGEADLERGDFITQEIDRALGAMDAPGILPTTGWGSVFAGTPGTNAKALSSLLDTVKANIGFQQLNQMRQQSPTGGALGNVTEQEMKFLQSVAGSLDQSQNADQLRDNLNRLWNVYMDTVHGKGQGPARRELGFENKGGTIEPPPNGIDPEDWKHMSPEERKLWQ